MVGVTWTIIITAGVPYDLRQDFSPAPVLGSQPSDFTWNDALLIRYV
jgi:hypothetical protein